MNGYSIFMVIISAAFLLCTAIPGKEQFISLVYYALLFAILVEIGCIHETLKERSG